MNYRTWRTYLADTMEYLGLTEAEAITHIDGVLRAKRFPEKWKYNVVKISHQALTTLSGLDFHFSGNYVPALREAINQPSAFVQALDREMAAAEADIAGEMGRQMFGGTHAEHVKAHNEFKVKMEARRAYNAVWHRRARKFLTKQRHPVTAVANRLGYVKHEECCDDDDW